MMFQPWKRKDRHSSDGMPTTWLNLIRFSVLIVLIFLALYYDRIWSFWVDYIWGYSGGLIITVIVGLCGKIRSLVEWIMWFRSWIWYFTGHPICLALKFLWNFLMA
jgi:hypothetical protein